jgi:small subunit ribosomal protein S6
VVVRVDLPEDGHATEMERVKALIDRFGGTIDKIDEWGRRRLSYPIEKQTEGIYTFITFTADSSAPKEIESRMRLMENVLRYLMVRKDEVEELTPPAPVVVDESPEAPVAPAEEVIAADAPVEATEPTEPDVVAEA